MHEDAARRQLRRQLEALHAREHLRLGARFAHGGDNVDAPPVQLGGTRVRLRDQQQVFDELRRALDFGDDVLERGALLVAAWRS